MIYSHTRPANAVAGYVRFWLGIDGAAAQAMSAITVTRCWQHGRRMLLQLDGVDNIEQAARFVHHKLWVKRDDIHVDDDEYLWDDLIGVHVIDNSCKKDLGTVCDIQDFGAQDTLIIKANDGVWMIPFIDSIVTHIDDCIHVSLPEGMDACFTPNC